jgi:putative DNA methylase
MNADTIEMLSATSGLSPLSLQDAPSFIEVQFPVGRLSAEAYKERKAGPGQTLTALGSYWKGRKPLILCRAVVLGCLLPATDNPAKDLNIFLKLMAIDDRAFARRFDGSANEFARLFPAWADLVTEEDGRRRVWREDLDDHDRETRVAEAFASLPYSFDQRLKHVRRPEECDEEFLLAGIWSEVNRHLGTYARSIPELVEQLGIARFGHRPRVADTFCGGGSIPFEAARIGCDVYASDLNPIACMLTWGAFNIIGADGETRTDIDRAQRAVSAAVDHEIMRLGVEHDEHGNRAKAYLYCLETRCPRTGWMVPMAPSWIVSTSDNVVAKLVPDHSTKRYLIEIHSNVSEAEMTEAAKGTVRGLRLVHPMNPEGTGVEIKTIRGDSRDKSGTSHNRLRLWTASDFIPRPDDIFQERLYCIQWITKDTLNKSRQETFFTAPTEHDLARQRQVEAIVAANLRQWQAEGLVPDMRIEPGDKTDEPIRTRGWTHWHHLFGPRDLWKLFLVSREGYRHPALSLNLCSLLDFQSKLSRWIIRHRGTGGSEFTSNVFSNMALNPLYNWGNRSWAALEYVAAYKTSRMLGSFHVVPHDAKEIKTINDIFITDPPYADAISYHEITEYFIAWLHKNPPSPLDEWDWDSHRVLAIKGKDEGFRRDMVAAYAAMTRQMPDNGMQVVMFTHQDAGVWADLGAILWAARLSVCSAWNVVTETEKPGGEGNYVQGTVCLVLRKRLGEANARSMEIRTRLSAQCARSLTGYPPLTQRGARKRSILMAI